MKTVCSNKKEPVQTCSSVVMQRQVLHYLKREMAAVRVLRTTEVILGTPRRKRARGFQGPWKGWERRSGSPLLQSMKLESYPQPRDNLYPGVCLEASTDLTSAVYCLENSVSPPVRTSGSCARVSVAESDADSYWKEDSGKCSPRIVPAEQGLTREEKRPV